MVPGRLRTVDTARAGAFVGQDGLASRRPRNAAGHGPEPAGEAGQVDGVAVDMHAPLDQKIAALVAHRSQYALDAELLPARCWARC